MPRRASRTGQVLQSGRRCAGIRRVPIAAVLRTYLLEQKLRNGGRPEYRVLADASNEHASISITMDRYGHLMLGSEAEAAGRLDAYLEGAADG